MDKFEIINGLATATLSSLLVFLVARTRRLPPHLRNCGAGKVFELEQGRVWVLLSALGGAALVAVGIAISVVLIPLLARDSAMQLSMQVFAVSVVLSMFVTGLGMLCVALRAWHSKIVIFREGLLFGLWPRKPVFIALDRIEHIEYWKQSGDIRITATNRSRYRVGATWNGTGLLCLCLFHFAGEEKWRGSQHLAREFMIDTYEFESVISKFDEALSNGFLIAAADIDSTFR